MKNLKVGDIVKCVSVTSSNESLLNKIGRIVEVTNVNYGIEFSDFYEGHNCGGKL